MKIRCKLLGAHLNKTTYDGVCRGIHVEALIRYATGKLHQVARENTRIGGNQHGTTDIYR